MKLTSYFFLVFALTVSPALAMEPQQESVKKKLGWFESFLPGTFATAEKSTDALKKISDDGLVVKHDLDDFTHDLANNGIKVVMDKDSIKQIKKASNTMVKTWITAGAGGALMLGGLILLLHTLMKKTDERDDTDSSYFKILSNRYLISTLLMASGLLLVIKSDTMVSLGAKG